MLRNALAVVACWCLFAVPSSHSLLFIDGNGRPVVDVNQGRILGMNDTQEDVNLFAFRSIPYALPPKDELRFMAPVPSGAFAGELDASKNPHSCTQLSVTSREDCLYLNIYTPESAVDVDVLSNPLPVMVWIHGGGFVLGDIAKYDQVYPLVRKDVIVVLIQYRLGVLGFFSTDDDVAPGNQGLMDQTLALQWVNDNIAEFGGDTSRITLFGQSAGAASTHHQILAPSAQGLFDRAIMMSGNTLGQWSVGRDFYNKSRSLAQTFGCPLEPSAELVTCLQGVNYVALSGMYASFIEWNWQPFFFAPRVDGDYLPDEPATLIKEGRYSHVPIITGITKEEMAFETGELFLTMRALNTLMSDFPKNGPISLELLPEEDPVDTAYLVYNYYLEGIDINEENSPELTKMLSHNMFAIRHDWFVQLQADAMTTYIYEYDYRGQNTTMDYYANKGLDLPQGVDWVAHADDNKNLFDFKGPRTDPDDLIVQDMYTTLFTNFAKFGNPTPDDSLLGFQWPPASSSSMDHLSVKLSPEMKPDSRALERVFWESLCLKVNGLLRP